MAYRKLAQKFHPDLNHGDPFFEEKFKEIQEAYNVLSNSVSKVEYLRNFAKQDSETTDNSYRQYKTESNSRHQNNGQDSSYNANSKSSEKARQTEAKPKTKLQSDKSSNRIISAVLTIIACAVIGLIRGTLKNDAKDYAIKEALADYHPSTPTTPYSSNDTSLMMSNLPTSDTNHQLTLKQDSSHLGVMNNPESMPTDTVVVSSDIDIAPSQHETEKWILEMFRNYKLEISSETNYKFDFVEDGFAITYNNSRQLYLVTIPIYAFEKIETSGYNEIYFQTYRANVLVNNIENGDKNRWSTFIMHLDCRLEDDLVARLNNAFNHLKRFYKATKAPPF